MDDVLTWSGLKDRLAEKGRGATYQLAQKLGMNPSQLYRSLKSNRDLSERQARIAREFLGDPQPPGLALPPRLDRRRLEVYGFAAASDGELVALNEGNVIDHLELPMGLELGPGEYFVVRPIGSSMEPRIFPGEPLVVRRNYPPARDKDVIVEFKDGSGVIKTYKGQKDGHVHVEQFNPAKMLSYEATKVKALHAVAFKL